MDVVLAHLTDVLEHEAQTFQHSILNIQLWNTILIHKCRKHRKGPTSLRNNGNGHRCTDSKLTLLHLQVVEKGAQDIVWSYCLCNVTKCVDGSSSDCFLVRLQQFQQVEANTIPLTRWCQFSTSVCYPSHQIYAILLHLFVPVLQNRCQTSQQILDGWCHLCHTNHVDNCLHCPQNRTQHLRVLFTKVPIKEEAKVTH